MAAGLACVLVLSCTALKISQQPVKRQQESIHEAFACMFDWCWYAEHANFLPRIIPGYDGDRVHTRTLHCVFGLNISQNTVHSVQLSDLFQKQLYAYPRHRCSLMKAHHLFFHYINFQALSLFLVRHLFQEKHFVVG